MAEAVQRGPNRRLSDQVLTDTDNGPCPHLLMQVGFSALVICAWWLDHKQCINTYGGLRFHCTRTSYWISATSRRSRACAATFRFLEKVLRPSPPALRDARNGEQSLNLSSISSVNSKYVSNREIVIRSFDDPDLISSADRALNDDAQVCPWS